MMIDNVTKEGKTNDGFIIPAGSMFPLGCAIPNHTVSRAFGLSVPPPGYRLRKGTSIWDVFPTRDYGKSAISPG